MKMSSLRPGIFLPLCFVASALSLSAQSYQPGDATATTLVTSLTVATSGAYAGSLSMYAGSFVTPASGQLRADGASLDQATYSDLFAATGTAFGSNSGSTFNLPDLQGRAAVGPTLTNLLGTTTASTVALNFWIANGGVFPSSSDPFDNTAGTLPNPFWGQIIVSAAASAPSLYRSTASLLPIINYVELFSLMGTTYGGNGQSNFGLPDLRARSPVETSSGSLGLVTGSQLSLRYAIATQGLAVNAGESPPDDGFIHVGQIALFSFNFAPTGWSFLDGQTLPIAGNEALFAVLGTRYGGNGTTNFALPDLRDRTLLGASPAAIPEPGAFATVAGLSILAWSVYRRSRRDPGIPQVLVSVGDAAAKS